MTLSTSLRLAAFAALLFGGAAGCAQPRRRTAALPRPAASQAAPGARVVASGTVIDLTPRLILEELAWEHIVLVETPRGRLTVYAGDEDPGVRPGDKVRVTGELVAEDTVAGEVALLDSFDAS